MAFTKIVGAGIHTLSNVHSHNLNSSGIITATKFVGPITGGDFNAGIVTATSLDVNGNGDISGNLVLGGNLTVNGTTTTLDTNLIDVDKIEVTTAGTNVGVAVTHNGSGDLVRLYDGSTQVVTVDDEGNVGIGTINPKTKLNIYTHPHTDTGGILVQNANYSSNLNKAYLIAGTQAWTGATTDWSTYGFQHKLKSDASGSPRLTIDGSAGGSNVKEIITFFPGGNVGIGSISPTQKLDVDGTVKATSFSGNGANITSVNATTLDSIDSGSFLRSDATDTCSGQVTFTNQLIAKLDGVRATQTGVALVITHSTTPALRANHFIVDDYPSGGGTYFIQATEANVSNDRNLCLQGYGGKVKIGAQGTAPTEVLDVSGGNVKADNFIGGLPITNGADNRIVTCTSASAIAGESSFTYNAGLLIVSNASGNVTQQLNATGGDAKIVLDNSGNGNYSAIDFERERASGTGVPGGSIFMKSDTVTSKAHLYIQAQSASAQSPVTTALSDNNGVRLILKGADGIFSVECGSTEKFHIQPTGKVGIGTNNPDGKTHIYESSAGSVTAATDANDLVVESSANVGMSLLTANNSQARIKFGDPDETGAGVIAYNHQNDKFSIITATGNRMIIGADMISARTHYGVARTAGGYTFREVNEGGERAGMHSNASNELIFKILGASEAVRIESTNRIAIGNFTGASNDVHLKKLNNGGDVSMRITNSSVQNSGTTASLYFTTSSSQDFNTAYIQAARDGGKLKFGYATNSPTVTMRVSNKHVGINTDNPLYPLSIHATQNDANNEQWARFEEKNNANSKQAFGLVISSNARNSSGLEPTAYLKLEARPTSLNGSHGGNGIIAFSPIGVSQGTYGSGNLDFYIRHGGPYTFDNDPGNAGEMSPKVRILGGTSIPTLLVGQTSPHNDANGWTLRGDINTSSVKFTSTDVRTMFFMSSYHSTGSEDNKFAFHSNGTMNAINTTIQSFSSERRTKKNIVALDLTKAWNTLRDTPFYTFNFKQESDGSTLHHGPIVDECPEDLIVPTQKEDEVGVINTVNTEKLQYRAYSALQQALKRIETLEAEVAALKSS